MRFQLTHQTVYQYAGDATESFMEARLTPTSDARQQVLERTLEISPAATVRTHTDYFGNAVESFSILQRHPKLVITTRALVETFELPRPDSPLELTVGECRQLYRGAAALLTEYVLPSPAIALNASVSRLANRLFRSATPLGECLDGVLDWVKGNLRYVPGSTRIDTPVDTVLQQRTGVCQDFAQVMIAILRSADLPARYVTGYIETETERKAAERGEDFLVGASESHAWVEVWLPGGFWYPLDPTNHCAAGERHVKVAHGRDYTDTAPTRGVFKGASTQGLVATVAMQRLTGEPPAAEPEPESAEAPTESADPGEPSETAN